MAQNPLNTALNVVQLPFRLAQKVVGGLLGGGERSAPNRRRPPSPRTSTTARSPQLIKLAEARAAEVPEVTKVENLLHLPKTPAPSRTDTPPRQRNPALRRSPGTEVAPLDRWRRRLELTPRPPALSSGGASPVRVAGRGTRV